MSPRPRHPLVSVVVPTRDRTVLLARALQSVISQTERDLEILVIDDGSVESAAPVVEQLADDRLVLLTHDQPRGAAAARNTGLKIARGAFIATLDDDDTWEVGKLACQLAHLTRLPPTTGLVYCGYQVASARTGGIVNRIIPKPPVANFTELLRTTIFGSSIPLVRKQCFERVGLFDESLPGTQDRDMWLRIARAYELSLVPDVLATCFVHGRQITTDLAAKIQAKERILEKYRQDLARVPVIHANHWLRLALLYLAAGRSWRGRQCLVRALRLHRDADTCRHLAIALLPAAVHRPYVQRRAFRVVDGHSLYH